MIDVKPHKRYVIISLDSNKDMSMNVKKPQNQKQRDVTAECLQKMINKRIEFEEDIKNLPNLPPEESSIASMVILPQFDYIIQHFQKELDLYDEDKEGEDPNEP